MPDSQPSTTVIENLKNQEHFASDIDNSDEDKLALENEEVDRIKLHKFKERVRRTDLLVAQTALEDIKLGCEQAKEKVNVRTCLNLNLIDLRQRQDQIR